MVVKYRSRKGTQDELVMERKLVADLSATEALCDTVDNSAANSEMRRSGALLLNLELEHHCS